VSGSAISRNFTHYVYLCVCLHVRDMHAAARALSLFHSQGSGHFHALYACGSAGTFTLPLSRQRGGTWACRRRRSVGLQRVEFVWFAFESVVRVLWSCGPAGVVCAVMLSAMHAHDLAPPMSAAVSAAALAAATREVALEAWRWRLGAGGLALEASWPVAVRRRALGAMLQCSSSACRS